MKSRLACEVYLRAQSKTGSLSYYRETSREAGIQGCSWAGRSVHSEVIDAQIMMLISHLRLPDNWRQILNELLQQVDDRPDPEAERTRLRAELRRLRKGYRRGLYEGEEFIFWREVDDIQERIAVLKKLPPSDVEQSAQQIISLRKAWEIATREERSELVHILFKQVGCDIPSERITWVKPHHGFEPIFQMLSNWQPDSQGRYACPAAWLGLTDKEV